MRALGKKLVLLAALALVATNLPAQAPPTVLYYLQPGSTYEEGCYGKCMCPVLQAPLTGTFGLELLPAGAPFDVYAVDPVDFSVPILGKQLVGSGFYQRLGELNAMELDLQTDGVAQQFSSGGFVPAGAEFPEIDIVVSVNQMQECFDTVLHIVASPFPPPFPDLAVGHTELTWSPVEGAASYDAVCGSLAYLHGSAGDYGGAVDLCLGSDHPATSLSYDQAPETGQALWFLVREDGGSYDSGGASQAGSRDPGIDASPLACP